MKRNSSCLLPLLVFAAWIPSGCATAPPRTAASSAPAPAVAAAASAQPTLTVALYPYVPRFGQFQQAITQAWAAARPDVPLHFLPAEAWDGGYSMDPPPNADVYVFDAMFFDLFQSKGWLEPLGAGEIEDVDDFVDYAIEGVKVGDRYYAIPQLGCANILFYQKDDRELASATTLTAVASALNQCTYTSKLPPDRRGLMLDMAGSTTTASLYLDAAHSETGIYPLPLPPNPSEINPSAMKHLRLLLALSSFANATSGDIGSYQRGEWFSQGWGRALIGYTESMSAMSEATRNNLDFKVMPLSDHDTAALFYADVIGVNTTTRQRNTRDLAVELANVMASRATMIASIGKSDQDPEPQFLMATRPSIFAELGKTFPIYNRMYGLLQNSNPVLFRLNDQSREWLKVMKGPIRSESRAEYPCGCDFPAASPIPDNSSAAAICNATCADRGGWSGAWTNQYPAVPSGGSACGCNACPVS